MYNKFDETYQLFPVKTAFYGLDTEPELVKVGTGTVINSYDISLLTYGTNLCTLLFDSSRRKKRFFDV